MKPYGSGDGDGSVCDMIFMLFRGGPFDGETHLMPESGLDCQVGRPHSDGWVYWYDYSVALNLAVYTGLASMEDKCSASN